eukprot:15466663-Alexandrium_andersonii.AAC.1
MAVHQGERYVQLTLALHCLLHAARLHFEIGIRYGNHSFQSVARLSMGALRSGLSSEVPCSEFLRPTVF